MLAKADPVCLGLLFAGMDASPGQVRFINAVVSADRGDRQIVAKVHRKAGKTLCVAVALAWLFMNDPSLRVFHLAGSFIQANRLYQHFRPLISRVCRGELDGEPTRYWTRFKAGGFLEVLTSSAKSIRGGDADVLSIDEVVEVPQALIDAAWPLVRASKHPKRIIISTASSGQSLDWFVRLWQQADMLGFKRFEWGPEECSWLDREDSELAKLMLDSRTYAVEYEGAIAQNTGRVWDNNLIDAACKQPLPPMGEGVLTEKWTSLDWGFIGMAVLTFWEKQGDTVILRDCRIWKETSYQTIKAEIKAEFGQYPIYPDSEAVADNRDLVNMGLQVRPVIFSTEKEYLISRVRWRLEKGLLKLPNPEVDGKYWTLINQLKAYHYVEKTGKPEKINDHCCDSVICGMKHVDPNRPRFTAFISKHH